METIEWSESSNGKYDDFTCTLCGYNPILIDGIWGCDCITIIDAEDYNSHPNIWVKTEKEYPDAK